MNTKNTTSYTVYVHYKNSITPNEELTLAFSSLREATDYADTISEYTGYWAEIVKE